MPQNDDLVARDSDLPGLATLLDPVFLEEAIGAPIKALGSLRYKPHTSCTRSVEMADGRFLWLKALPEARYARAKAKDRARGQDLAPEALQSLKVVLQSPAADKDVPALNVLWSGSGLAEGLAALLGAHPLATARLIPVSHRPTRRLVAHLHGATGRAFFKAYAAKSFDQAREGGRLAEQLGHGVVIKACPIHKVIVSHWVDGSSLCPGSGASSPAMAAAAGRTLAAIHDIDVETESALSRHDRQHRLRMAASDLGALLPADAAHFARTAEHIITSLVARPEDIGLVHGDFTGDQVIVSDSGKITIIDWDRAATGDRGGDLAAFLARLEFQSLCGDISGSTAQAYAASFVAGYAARRALPASWHVQKLASLFLLLTEPFRHQRPGWPELTRKLHTEIARQAQALAPAEADAALPQIPTLLTQAGLRRVLPGGAGWARVSSGALLRHKPGRRAIIEARAEDAGGRAASFLIKTRSKRPDQVTPKFHRALREAGFTKEGARGFAVPEAWPSCPYLRSWPMRKVPGTQLTDLLVPEGPTQPFAQTGRALAELHGTRIDGVPLWSMAQEAEVFDCALSSALSRARDSRPEDTPDLLAIREAARPLFEMLDGDERGLLHRDFYPDQILVDGDRIWMIDLDLLAMGNPQVDLGNFLAHLDEKSLRLFGHAEAYDDQARAFLAGYAEIRPFRAEAVKAARFISLARHLHICARVPGRAGSYEALLKALMSSVEAPIGGTRKNTRCVADWDVISSSRF